MNKHNKRGISTIIATVLIVLITVAAVTILWAAVSPLIDQTADLSCFEVANALKVDTNAEFTNVPGAGTTLNVRVERGANSGSLQGLVFLVDIDGSSDVITTVEQGTTSVSSDNSGSVDETNLPTQNGAKVYTLTTTTSMDADSEVKVAIAPVLTIEGENTQCDATSPVLIKYTP